MTGPLKNPKHERFAQELAKGKTAFDAYTLAGYAENDGNSIRLKGNERVASRVAELQSRGAKRAEVTVESLIAEAEEARQLALEMGQASAAVAATREKGILSGKRVERSEIGKPGDFETMDDDTLDAFISSREGGTGEGAGRKGSASNQKGMRGKPSGLH